jgi:diguanylate cyclase (GGDEF)-like protein/PAS domain S-box-containing protein
VLFYTPESMTAQVYLPFVLAGLVGGSLTALTGYLPAFAAFYLCALGPYATRLGLEADMPHLTMATLVVLYMIGVALLGRTVNASLITSVRLAVENEELVGALREKSAQLEATFNHVHQGVAVFDRHGRLVTWNPRHRALHGYPEDFYRRGTLLAEFVRRDLRRSGETVPRDLEEQTLSAAMRHPAPARFEQPGAGDRILEVERSPMPDGGFVNTSTDITERKRAERHMLHLAQHDPLTNLPNRLLFHDRVGQAMARCVRHGGRLAVMLLDLDKFKEINDALGHRVGDQALKEVARRLSAALRGTDTVARIGGDEFALILPDLHDPRAAALIAQKLIATLDQPFELEDRSPQLRASIGIAIFPEDGTSAEQLLQNADLAMYVAKAEGGGFRPFRATLKVQFDVRQRMERELGQAIERGQLSLEYQPQVDLAQGRVSGFEALLRWQHPELGPIDAQAVIRAAEAGGQIVRIGDWALAEACAAARGWPDGPDGPLRVAVNCSATQLTRGNLVCSVSRALEESGLPADRLELELTESSVLDQIERVTDTLQRLRARGVRLALDDFGTGYGSLSRLKLLPLDALKIDRSFTADLVADPDAPIVRALVDLGQRLGLRVVAEGAESEAQLDALFRLGCDEVQGHAVSPPLAHADIAAWLGARQAPAEVGLP